MRQIVISIRFDDQREEDDFIESIEALGHDYTILQTNTKG